mmetsp:Transcript_9685/g.21634  ORF Transcript_9685/g.21634 Transcript_9685/m.21634 type:complete len:671 (+) Transcript_9685:155-2167(+)
MAGQDDPHVVLPWWRTRSHTVDEVSEAGSEAQRKWSIQVQQSLRSVEPAAPGALFKEINSQRHVCLDEKISGDASKYSDGIWGRLARNVRFEALTMFVIVISAAVTGIRTDRKARLGKGEIPYRESGFLLLLEHLFAVYFIVELALHFAAFEKKSSCLCSAWFLFDATITCAIVFEAWILPFIGHNSQALGSLSLLRLLRLVRITRMAQLMKLCPELLMVINGITAATKAVVWTALLLVMVTLTWAILFTSVYNQGNQEEEEVDPDSPQFLFGTMGKSMVTLLVMGTLLDEVTACTDVLRAAGSIPLLAAFLTYILINSFTTMNMLIGILVEVVSSTSEGERNKNLEESVHDSIKMIFGKIDQDGSGHISRTEFLDHAKHPMVVKALQQLQIDDRQFEMYVEILFENSQASMDGGICFDTLMKTIMRLRPGKAINALEFASFGQQMVESHTDMQSALSRIEAACEELCADIPQEPELRRTMVSSSKVYSDEDLDEDDETPMSDLPMLAEPTEDCDGSVVDVRDSMWTQLEGVSSQEILAELQRRLADQEKQDISSQISGTKSDLAQGGGLAEDMLEPSASRGAVLAVAEAPADEAYELMESSSSPQETGEQPLAMGEEPVRESPLADEAPFSVEASVSRAGPTEPVVSVGSDRLLNDDSGVFKDWKLESE